MLNAPPVPPKGVKGCSTSLLPWSPFGCLNMQANSRNTRTYLLNHDLKATYGDIPCHHTSCTAHVLLPASIPLITRTFWRVWRPYNPLRCLNISPWSQLLKPLFLFITHHTKHVYFFLASIPLITRTFCQIPQPYGSVDPFCGHPASQGLLWLGRNPSRLVLATISKTGCPGTKC
jgi:hypothetical protein